MCAGKASLRNSVSGACIKESTKLREFVDFTLNMAHEQVAWSRVIVAKSQEIVGRTRKTLAHSGRIQQGDSRNPLMRPDLMEVELDVPG